jgi:hypothetical protein
MALLTDLHLYGKAVGLVPRLRPGAYVWLPVNS